MENHHATFQIQAKILIMKKACFVGLLQSVSKALIALLFFFILVAEKKKYRILPLFLCEGELRVRHK